MVGSRSSVNAVATSTGCKGKIKVNGNQFLVTHVHHHAPNPARNDVLKIRSSIKRRAQTTLDSTRTVVGKVAMLIDNQRTTFRVLLTI